MAAKATQNATEEDIKQLNSILEKIANYLKLIRYRMNEILKEDKKFHLALARMAGNRIFESILSTIYENTNPYLARFLVKDRVNAKRNYQSLCKIAEAITKRQPNKARVLAERHVTEFWPNPLV